MLTRRELLRYAASAGACLATQGLLPEWARAASGVQATNGPRTGPHDFDLTIADTPIRIDGRPGTATALNGTIPGPLMRFTEGETVTIRAHNRLRESTSVHWHGILLPYQMDGVPGVTYPGIAPGETFTYRFTLKQAGTYWYHSHTRLQEQLGLNGPLIVDPRGPEPFAYTREHVVVLTDWMFADPYAILAKLKKESDYSNFQRRTVGDFFHDVSREGFRAALKDRAMWGRMRMAPSDIADVTGHLYTYLMNGQGPVSGWTGLFTPGERVRLRLINASAMTYFNVRVPDLSMTVVLADGQPVEPVTVDELQIAVAETFDVIVEPRERAYTLFAEAMDRSGYARGTLAPREGMTAPVPALRTPPRRTMVDMGMVPSGTMADMNMGAGHQMTGGGTQADHPTMTMGGGDGGHDMMATSGVGPVVARHGPDHHGPGNATVPEVERNRLGERGTGLAAVDHRVLVYTDLQALESHKQREPDRQIELHLTGNMERYMWSFDGKKFSEVTAPIPFRYGERLRLVLVNDTMMEHPIHLHGMWMNLENGHGDRIPRKHTISVKPAERLSVLVDADAPGRWAFHCHLLFHMEMGMFRVVEVSPYEGELP